MSGRCDVRLSVSDIPRAGGQDRRASGGGAPARLTATNVLLGGAVVVRSHVNLCGALPGVRHRLDVDAVGCRTTEAQHIKEQEQRRIES